MKALYLSLVLFIGSSSVTVSGCICDASKHINIKVVNSVGKNLGAIKNKLGTASSKQLCVSYSIRKFFGIPWPTFNKNDINNAVTTKTCNPKNSDGSIDCIIEDPFFAIPLQCYPPKLFCVHQVVCPLDHIASIQCSSLGLPKNNGKCLDAVNIDSGRIRNKEVCGSTYENCFPDINEAGGSIIRITFTSGECCQYCGYRLWVRCVPHAAIHGFKRQITKETHLKAIPGPSIGPPGSRPIVSVVPFGAVVTYKNGTLTVKLGTLKLQERKTPKLQVRDDLAFGTGNLFEAKTSANRSFVGYGIMTVYCDRIYYHQQGIPTQEEPNSTEREFIKAVIAHIRTKVKSNILLNTTSISLSQKSRGQAGLFSVSSCQCGSLRPVPPPKAPHGVGPSPSFIAKARHYAKYSTKPIVKYWAKLFLKYYDKSTTPDPTKFPGPSTSSKPGPAPTPAGPAPTPAGPAPTPVGPPTPPGPPTLPGPPKLGPPNLSKETFLSPGPPGLNPQ